MTLPNFLVIGAGRSGTTSLGRYLAQHPDVYLPRVKAPSHFFCCDLGRLDDRALRLVTRNHFVPERSEYEALFAAADGERAIGEVSPVYLASHKVPPRIASTLPGVKLIAILRNPVDRVWARYVGRRRDGLERRSFREVLAAERREQLSGEDAFGTYLAGGFCSPYLRRYKELFGTEQLRVHLYEDFARDPAAVTADLFSFLGVDPSFPVDVGVRHNQSGGEIGNRALRWLWTRSAMPRAALRRYVPEGLRDAAFRRLSSDLSPLQLDPAVRAELTELYADEVDRLAELIGRDLGAWRRAPLG